MNGTYTELHTTTTSQDEYPAVSSIEIEALKYSESSETNENKQSEMPSQQWIAGETTVKSEGIAYENEALVADGNKVEHQSEMLSVAFDALKHMANTSQPDYDPSSFIGSPMIQRSEQVMGSDAVFEEAEASQEDIKLNESLEKLKNDPDGGESYPENEGNLMHQNEATISPPLTQPTEPFHDQPESISSYSQPEVIPSYDQPEIISSYDQPEMVPSHDQSEMIPSYNQPEVIASYDEPEAISSYNPANSYAEEINYVAEALYQDIEVRGARQFLVEAPCDEISRKEIYDAGNGQENIGALKQDDEGIALDFDIPGQQSVDAPSELPVESVSVIPGQQSVDSSGQLPIDGQQSIDTSSEHPVESVSVIPGQQIVDASSQLPVESVSASQGEEEDITASLDLLETIPETTEELASLSLDTPDNTPIEDIPVIGESGGPRLDSVASRLEQAAKAMKDADDVEPDKTVESKDITYTENGSAGKANKSNIYIARIMPLAI